MYLDLEKTYMRFTQKMYNDAEKLYIFMYNPEREKKGLVGVMVSCTTCSTHRGRGGRNYQDANARFNVGNRAKRHSSATQS